MKMLHIEPVIIGIDPAYAKPLAVAIIDTRNGELKSTHSINFHYIDNTKPLWDFVKTMAGWIAWIDSDIVLAVEEPYLKHNVATTMKLAKVVGYIKASFELYSKFWKSLTYIEVKPAEWQNSIGLTKPKRKQVLNYVCRYAESAYGFKTSDNDIACAICIADYTARHLIAKEHIEIYKESKRAK